MDVLSLRPCQGGTPDSGKKDAAIETWGEKHCVSSTAGQAFH